ncbi:MAG TPA: YbhB/YbcL family Raf kinase inhibitor-like protein [Stellaceae bacterium]|nr:YbhB/YbcL family Raf kinase inhibitor-like protein [Stellaceae bacterium]
MDTEAFPRVTLRLTSTAFAPGGVMPKRFTADDANVSPPLAWSGAPARTQSFALICSDAEAPGGVWYHWAIFDIPADCTALAEHLTPENGTMHEAINDFHRRGYSGPAPPHGHGRHHYYFRLYALAVDRLKLSSEAGCRDVEAEAEVNALAMAELVGVYSR